MKSLNLKNFRSIECSGDIELKPLTVLLGTNSSGKSSFLRVLPLLKQSIETKSRGPILWFGNYVDFGSYTETVFNKDLSRTIEISFCLSLSTPQTRQFSPIALLANSKANFDASCRIVFTPGSNGPDCYIKELHLLFLEYRFSLYFSQGNVIVKASVNDEDMTGLLKRKRLFQSGGFLPVVPTQFHKESGGFRFFRLDSEVILQLQSFFKQKTGEDFSPSEIIEIINQAKFPKQLKLLESFELNWFLIDTDDQSDLNKPRGIKELQHIILKWLSPDEIDNLLFTHSLLLISFWVLSKLDETLSDELRQTVYLAPLRSTAERYYRNQNLSVDVVDFRGQNLPMYLSGLKKDKREKLAEWTKQYFGFSLDLAIEEGHTSLMIQEQDKRFNLADVGFGYSQLLPIIIDLWDILERKTDQPIQKTIVIEQPELHLHPKMQAQLIDLIIETITNKDLAGKVKIILETHSQTMVNWIGVKVYRRQISPLDVGIYTFEKSSIGGSTSINMTVFSEDGFLQNWPIDFFEPEER